MNVSDVMQKSVISVSQEASIKEVGRMIFSLGISGIPIVKNKKLVGIVTEHDILLRLYPSMTELIEDYAHARSFEEMEKSLSEMMNVPVSRIMNTNFISVDEDVPLMKAQSLMLVNRISRLPIVDNQGNLVGIVSQGDIFRELLKNEIPKLERERYAGFIANNYDIMVDWETRFGYEFPALFQLLKSRNVKGVLDLGVWTGEYTIGLAKRGKFKVLGLDNNPYMIQLCEGKREKLRDELKKDVNFKLVDFKDFSGEVKGKFDSAICMGNSLPYIPASLPEIFRNTYDILRKDGVFVIQLLNFEKILRKKSRLLSFDIQPSKEDGEKEHLFMEFFDKNGGVLLHHVVVFDCDGDNWVYKGITTVPISDISKEDVEDALKEVGFKDIIFSGNKGEYQGEYGPLSFEEPFKSLESDWLNVVAMK